MSLKLSVAVERNCYIGATEPKHSVILYVAGPARDRWTGAVGER